MDYFSKFRENVVDRTENKSENPMENGHSPLQDPVSQSPTLSEKGLIESVGEILQHSAHNMKEAVIGRMDRSSDYDGGCLPLSLAMEEPFGQGDPVLTAVVEDDLRSSIVNTEKDRKDRVDRTAEENPAESAHNADDAVFSHRMELNIKHLTEPSDLIQYRNNDSDPVLEGAEDHRTIIKAVGDMVLQSVQTVRVVLGNHNDVVETSPSVSNVVEKDQESGNGNVGDDEHGKKIVMESVSDIFTRSVETVKEAVLKHNTMDHENMQDVRMVVLEQESASSKNLEDEEGKGLMKSVKEAAQEVKAEVMEAMQEVKDAVLGNETLSSVSAESITEDSGERPSMELVHTIVHD
ncbi:uncharacterized protein [Physcomitrium patens]|uniref:Uncharacterized protein n=1 Tax=Physcomitrium patens TaxID=3218 RepID=A9T5W5_PHYPA|nr:uncharacterized protein LOC112296155 isoform X1 [Physcomitrium patens]PNR34499.1 hypothetical protein PHYPA_024316 [Physcomitrium patens]|eukprot:XP_024404173.1 uncharacterized protein LOC112296155 isoform X1 [Physcomitrella patens]